VADQQKTTLLLRADEAAIARAAGVLRRGGLVGFPTETVYGLGAAADDESALRALFAAKGRPADHPVIVHVADVAQIHSLVEQVPPLAARLMNAFWPGPMTLLFRRSGQVSDLVTGGRETVGIRVPVHPIAQSLLRALGRPLAAPSANRFGRVSPTSAQHVFNDLAGRVDLILDGGDCSVGLESTIIDVSTESPAILRPGGVTAEQVENMLGVKLQAATADHPRVSGGLPSHYAPLARVEVLSRSLLADRAAELTAMNKHVAVLAIEQTPPAIANAQIIHMPANDAEYARALYHALRRVDELGCDVALVERPAGEGIGVAVIDRLTRAAGPRDT
jgi:L-threonylcarbamoyladenylate synthase